MTRPDCPRLAPVTATGRTPAVVPDVGSGAVPGPGLLAVVAVLVVALAGALRPASAAAAPQTPSAAVTRAPATGAADAPTWAAPAAAGVWPLHPEPTVVARFDPPLFRYGPGHRGVDLAGTAGQVVRSALPGRVIFAGLVAGRGVVVVSHGATRTTYEPVSATVPVGSTVSAGEEIGVLQAHGSHCGLRVCLHWGLLEGKDYLDPLTLVGAGPVRLLPLAPVAPFRVPAAVADLPSVGWTSRPR